MNVFVSLLASGMQLTSAYTCGRLWGIWMPMEQIIRSDVAVRQDMKLTAIGICIQHASSTLLYTADYMRANRTTLFIC